MSGNMGNKSKLAKTKKTKYFAVISFIFNYKEIIQHLQKILEMNLVKLYHF